LGDLDADERELISVSPAQDETPACKPSCFPPPADDEAVRQHDVVRETSPWSAEVPDRGFVCGIPV